MQWDNLGLVCFLQLSRSQLLAMFVLRSPGEDRVLTRNQDRLFVSMPGAHSGWPWSIPTPGGLSRIWIWGRTRHLGFQSDEACLWVG